MSGEAPRQHLRNLGHRAKAVLGVGITVASGVLLVDGLTPDLPHITLNFPGHSEPGMEHMPKALPPAVQRVVGSVVKVSYNASEKSGKNGFDISLGSGFKSGADEAVTAGHVLLEGNSHRRFRCAYSKIIGKYSQPQHETQIEYWKASFYGDSYKKEDAALIKVRPNEAFAKLPVAKVAKTQPSRGSAVFFVGYPGAGRDYTPNAAEARVLPQTGNKANTDHPAEYLGEVLGKQGIYTIIATHLKAYGARAPRTSLSHHGQSGSPVFNEAGHVFAITTSIGSTELTARNLEGKYHVKLPVPPQQHLQETFVQPITSQMLRSYETSMGKHALC